MKFVPVFATVMFGLFVGETLAQRPEENIVPVMKSSPVRRMPRVDMNDFRLGDVRGTVKSVALRLPKAFYPEEARKQGVEGLVRVQVTVDDKGLVTKALTIAGDNRLTSSAIDAALQSRFRPALDPTGRPVAIEGILTYSYEIGKASWSRIAVELRGIDAGFTSGESLFVLAKTLDPSWTDEIAAIGRMSKLSQTSQARPGFVRIDSQMSRAKQGTSASLSQAKGVILVVPSAEQRSLARNLIAALRNRLANDELRSWQFETGLNLFSAFYLSTAIPTPGSHGPERFVDAGKLMKSSLEKRPQGVPDDIVRALQDLEMNFSIEKRTKDEEEAVSNSIIKILICNKEC
jgi:TonB family protein